MNFELLSAYHPSRILLEIRLQGTHNAYVNQYSREAAEWLTFRRTLRSGRHRKPATKAAEEGGQPAGPDRCRGACPAEGGEFEGLLTLLFSCGDLGLLGSGTMSFNLILPSFGCLAVGEGPSGRGQQRGGWGGTVWPK